MTVSRIDVQTRIYRIEVSPTAAAAAAALRSARLYFLQGDLEPDEVAQIAAELLTDPVAETYAIDEPLLALHTIDVTFLPGVTDPAAENLVRAARMLGINGLQQAATGYRYLLDDALSRDELEALATGVYANPVIQRVAVDAPISAPFVPVQHANDTVETIPLRDADDDGLMAISRERRLSLDVHEMRAIRAYFSDEHRDPTDAELEMLAQTWSEHCVHKTFRARIDYTGPEGEITVDGILKTYLRAATDAVNKPWVRSAFVDNAGIIRFDAKWDLAFKVETHNRPSAIEPFGGANTGVGGVIRDVLGVSARPIANTDILFFAPPDMPFDDLPVGVLHPKRIADGVVAGIEDYGNKMGIPTVNGAIYYDRRYAANPLVFCGCLGLLPHGSHRTGAEPGDLIVVLGGRTGRDGLRGATFSSMEMDTTTSSVSGGAVQIGHAIHEKQVQEVVLRARDEGLYSAITDCGAGGLSSAVGEMGEHLGATVQLRDVPLKYPGLQPWEIWLSEAQERMVLAVPPEHWARFKQLADGQDIDATAIGAFEPTGRLTLRYGERVVGDLAMDFLHDGIPQRHMQAVWEPPVYAGNVQLPLDEDLNDTLLSLLALPTIRSKEDVIRRYDHEVQGATALKPLVGVANAGPSDAAVLVPDASSTQAVALSVGLCPQYTELDPYAMAWAAIDEAIRNAVAVGADPDQIAILDNFSWGNTNLPDRLGSLVRAAQGCHDAAIAYGTPFISGKDSLNNEYVGADGERHAIPGTLVISAVGIVPDVAHTVTMDLKQSGNRLYLIGETRDEMGGSHYDLLHGITGGSVPQPMPGALDVYRLLHEAIRAGVVRACHDVSEGGIAVALAEMCIGGRVGADVAVDVSLFAESNARFIVEVSEADSDAFERRMGDAACTYIGQVAAKQLTISSRQGDGMASLPVVELERAWRGEVAPVQVVPVHAESAAEAQPVPNLHSRPRVLILHANGTNRDHDAFRACDLAGGAPEIVHVNQLISGERDLLDYHMLIVPGGFSYGDDLGAGVLWALDLRHRLGDPLARFIAEGRPVLGICNGFQTLVKAGLLPGEDWSGAEGRSVTLTHNARERFECRWVYLQPNAKSPCVFTQGMTAPIYCPIAHGEGRVAVRDDATCQRLLADNLAALTYVTTTGEPADYPANPNGSAAGIAGLCNPAGNVFGLMPHPENHIFDWQHPRHHRGERGLDGLRLFANGIRYSKGL